MPARAPAAVRDRDRPLATLIESATDAIVVATPGGRLRLLNAAAERIFRCRAADMVGQPLERLLPKSSVSRSGAGRRSVRARRTDGQEFSAHIVALRLRHRGDVTCIVVGDRGGEPAHGVPGHVVPTTRDLSEDGRAGDTRRLMNELLDAQAKRIAHALHDGVAQFLTAAHNALSEASRGLGPAAAERVRSVKPHLDRIEEGLRQLAHELRPRILDDLGLADAIRFLVGGFQKRWGIATAVDLSVDRLPPAVEVMVYRLVQEALANVSKHGHASRVAIRLRQHARSLRGSVRDDGIGFDVSAVLARVGDQRLGLVGATDQLRALGGVLQIRSTLGRGTRLVFTIPLED